MELKKLSASSGNRTRAARVAGEHSTTEPTMLAYTLAGFLTNFVSERLLVEKVSL